MPDAALLARLAAAVDANFEKEVGFLADLVRFPSTRGNEAPLQDWMARQLAARGYGVDRYTLAEVPLAAHPKASPMVDVSAATFRAGGRHPPRRQPDRPQPDPAGPYRRGPGRAGGDVDLPALQRDHQGRLDVRPRRA